MELTADQIRVAQKFVELVNDAGVRSVLIFALAQQPGLGNLAVRALEGAYTDLDNACDDMDEPEIKEIVSAAPSVALIASIAAAARAAWGDKCPLPMGFVLDQLYLDDGLLMDLLNEFYDMIR